MKWVHYEKFMPYLETQAAMQRCVEAIQCSEEEEQIWLLEHPPLYTRGQRSSAQEILGESSLPIFETGRGGKLTYHGPGQRVCYVMCNLNKRGRDLRAYVKALEDWGILTLKHFGVKATRDEAGVGLWVNTPQGISKIAAIGVRVSKWITSHGIAFNVNPDLSHFSKIIPCGIQGRGVTSLKDLGLHVTLEEFDAALKKSFDQIIDTLQIQHDFL